MKQNDIVLLAVVAVAIGTVTVAGQSSDKSRTEFLSVLKQGQSVNLKNDAGRFEIIFMKTAPLAQKVTEVANDYIVIEDVAGVTETRIPIYSIKSIVQITVPKK